VHDRDSNLSRERLVDLLDRAPELRVLRERSRADLWGHCGTCYYADVCKGGCSWTAHSLLGRPGNNPYCIHRAMQLAKQGRRERLVQVAVAPGAPFDHGRFEIVEEDATKPLPRRVALPLLGVRAAPATR